MRVSDLLHMRSEGTSAFVMVSSGEFKYNITYRLRLTEDYLSIEDTTDSRAWVGIKLFIPFNRKGTYCIFFDGYGKVDENATIRLQELLGIR